MAKRTHRVVAVGEAHWIEATCMSRFLDTHGVPSAVHPAGPRRLEVRVGSRNKARAKKLLAKRKKGDCGPIRR